MGEAEGAALGQYGARFHLYYVFFVVICQRVRRSGSEMRYVMRVMCGGASNVVQHREFSACASEMLSRAAAPNADDIAFKHSGHTVSSHACVACVFPRAVLIYNTTRARLKCNCALSVCEWRKSYRARAAILGRSVYIHVITARVVC